MSAASEEIVNRLRLIGGLAPDHVTLIEEAATFINAQGNRIAALRAETDGDHIAIRELNEALGAAMRSHEEAEAEAQRRGRELRELEQVNAKLSKALAELTPASMGGQVKLSDIERQPVPERVATALERIAKALDVPGGWADVLKVK